MDYVKEYWAQVPFYNRTLLILLPSIYGISWLVPIHEWGLNHLQFTIFQRQVWRIITAPYIHPQLLMLFFVLLAYIPTGSMREKMIGTVKIMTDFILMNIMVQLIFLAICFCLKFVTEYWVNFISLGMWPIIIAEIVIE
mmetsp:Transcript_27213/g.24100  ORF Transcript_27213/g.24100 Transcript_27213/m.24100 type:complete len:139 (+) Transcript_27213:50-466(+)